jgi:protein gp37
MSDIEWTDLTWNPIIGCTRVRRGKDVASGCDNCYADDQVARFEKRYDRLTTIKLGATKRGTLTFVPKNPKTGKTLGHGAQWTGALWLLPDVLELPLRRKKPTTYFVNSLSDWAHESIVESEQGRQFLAAMFGVMAATPQHTYQLLTKRPDQARKWFEWARRAVANDQHNEVSVVLNAAWELLSERRRKPIEATKFVDVAWPLPNVWIGASVEDQATADDRIPALLGLPAALRFISAEPLLGPINLRYLPANAGPGLDGTNPPWDAMDALTGHGIDPQSGEVSETALWPHLDLGIVGGESGQKARPCDIDWLRSFVEQCKAAGVSCFVKQLGARPVTLGFTAEGQAAFRARAKTVGSLRAEGLDRDAALAAASDRHSMGDPGYYALAPMHLLDAKGGDMSEWPEDLRVREMPG